MKIDPALPALLAPLLLLAAGCAAPDPDPVRIVSYNIKHGRGMDDVVDLDRAAAVLRELGPDVVLLQEVDEVCARSGNVDEAAYLAEALGMEARFCSFMDHDGGRYGLAALSALPILRTERIELPDGTSEPRAAQGIVVEMNGEDVRVVGAHLDWKADGSRRREQATVLHASLAAGATGVDATVLGGDLNARPDSETLRRLTEPTFGLRRLGPDAPTFPSDAPDRTIDHFLVLAPEGAFGATRVWVVDEPMASDHCPVVLDLWVREGPAQP